MAMATVKRAAWWIAMVCVLQFPISGATQTSAAATTSRPLSVNAANALCRAHPAGRERIWLRGWFVLSRAGDGYLEGGLFDSREALPLVTVNQWNVDGNWRRYGALYVHIGTGATFGSPRSVTLHGVLDCTQGRLVTDRDPFAQPRLKTTYGPPVVARDGSVTTWAEAGGLKLTLTVPRRVYPRNALARVRVSLQNVTTHTVGYWTPGINPIGYDSPQTEVLSSSGKVLFPPAMPYMPEIPGPAPVLEPVGAGGTVTESEYIVVRGARIRATQRFVPQGTRYTGLPPRVLTTRPILVRLTSEPAPTLVVHGASTQPAIDVTRPPNVTGPMLEIDYADCGSTASDPFVYSYSYDWTGSTLHLTPGCAPLERWYVRVAWLNHPVAALDYTSPQPSPTPLPQPSPTPAPTATPTTTSYPSFASLIHRAAVAMASIHSMHAEGTRVSVDSSAQLHLQLHADCTSGPGSTLPVTLRTLFSGRQSEAGAIDEGYILQGPLLPAPHTTTAAWHRSSATHESWRSVDLHTQPAWGLTDAPIFSPDPAYVNQVCPNVLRLTYLTVLPAPSSIRQTVLGTTLLDGHRVWRLHDQQYFKADLYIDASTFRLRRLVLWDGSVRAAHWQIRFDYSKLNVPNHITAPK